MPDLTIGIPYSNCPYTSAIPCTCEEEAIAIAVGGYLGGKECFVFMQNSGFLRCLDVFTSLVIPYGIDIKYYIENRREPSHHRLAGELYPKLCEELKLLEKSWAEYRMSVSSAQQV